MKAVVLTQPKTLELMEVPEPRLIAENHVLIKVHACGICGSDLRYWAGENPWALHTLGRHVDNPPNMIMGHEFAGEVVKVNSSSHEPLLGKRFGVQSYRVCQACRFCTTGRENLCRNMVHIGHAQGWGKMDFYPGAYAEYCLGWADLLHPLTDHVSFAEGALADILCVAVHVAGRVKIYPGATVLCIGGGPAGLGTAQVAKVNGAARIFISDPSPVAREVISHYPGFTSFDPGLVSLADSLAEHRCAAVFDSLGTPETVHAAIPLLEEGGTYVNLAVHHASLNFDALLLGSERTVTTSSNAFYSDLIRAFELLRSGALDVKPWITHRFPLENYSEAFDLLRQSPKAGYKVVFEPWKNRV
jgi:threonine dehydrogenase-like Zn-dependent dehydrogenase